MIQDNNQPKITKEDINRWNSNDAKISRFEKEIL